MIQLGDRYKNSVQVVVEGLYDVIEEIVKMVSFNFIVCWDKFVEKVVKSINSGAG